MAPSDYQLATVVERLVQRLEGARPTHTDPESARIAFEEVARAHVEAVIAEYRAVAVEDSRAHATFLRREVLGTALPRYHRLAVGMTRQEQRGYGFGWLAGPIGPPFLLVVAVAVFGLVLRRMLGWWEVWPLVVLDATLPVWPLLAAWLHVRRYRADLEALIVDMERIQDAERSVLSEGELAAAAEVEAPRAQGSRPKEVERG